MKKHILTLLIFLFILSCSNPTKTLTFNPQNTRTYNIVMITEHMTFTVEIESRFEVKDDSVIMHSKVLKMEHKDGSEIEDQINNEYQRLVNQVITTIFNKQGKRIDTYGKSEIFNTELLVVEFPEQPIKKGDSWTSNKSAGSDIFFNRINVNYTCINIIKYHTEMLTIMTFEKDENSVDDGLNTTRKYIGKCTVNPNGVLDNARFEIRGFNGFSNTKGEIIIKTISEY